MGIQNLSLKKSTKAAVPCAVNDDANSAVVSETGRNVPAGPVVIDPKSFPDKSPRGDGVPSTIDNVRHMLAENAVVVRYNVIKKKTEIEVPWVTGTTENADGVAMTHIQSMASRYTMPTGLVPAITEAIAEVNNFNPVQDWIYAKPWDGADRLADICNTITPNDGYPLELRDTLITKWLLSAAAAALLPRGFRSRGVLTLQGAQSLGKTSWGLSLVNDDALRAKLLKVDHHLDAGNKDSQLGAIDHWIVEIGELESSFKRDVSRLKGFLTSGSDKIRRPYGRVTVEYQRRTVFYATVNASDFLIDTTGNARWWTIACKHIDYQHDIDMQQLFAQLATAIRNDKIWWLTIDEERLLEQQNSNHRSVSVVRDLVEAIIDATVVGRHNCHAFTASEVLMMAGIDRPTNSQAKECAAILRQRYGESIRINGRAKWRVPLGRNVTLVNTIDQDDGAPKKSKFD